MTVKELIERLHKMDEDVEVLLHEDEEYYSLEYVHLEENIKVWDGSKQKVYKKAIIFR